MLWSRNLCDRTLWGRAHITGRQLLSLFPAPRTLCKCDNVLSMRDDSTQPTWRYALFLPGSLLTDALQDSWISSESGMQAAPRASRAILISKATYTCQQAESGDRVWGSVLDLRPPSCAAFEHNAAVGRGRPAGAGRLVFFHDLSHLAREEKDWRIVSLCLLPKTSPKEWPSLQQALLEDWCWRSFEPSKINTAGMLSRKLGRHEENCFCRHWGFLHLLFIRQPR